MTADDIALEAVRKIRRLKPPENIPGGEAQWQAQVQAIVLDAIKQAVKVLVEGL